MAIFDPSIDSVEEVLAIREKAKSLLLSGVSVMSWASENSSVSKQFTMKVEDVMRETKDFLKAADPDLYGKKITRTTPKYL